MMDPGELQKVWILRKLLHDMDEIRGDGALDRSHEADQDESGVFFESHKRN